MKKLQRKHNGSDVIKMFVLVLQLYGTRCNRIILSFVHKDKICNVFGSMVG